MTDEHKALVARLRAYEDDWATRFCGQTLTQQAATALEAAHAARIAAEAREREAAAMLGDVVADRDRFREAMDLSQGGYVRQYDLREAAEAREREATALLRERDGGTHDPDCHINQKHRADQSCNCGHDAVEAFLAGSPAPRDVVRPRRASGPIDPEKGFATSGAEERWIEDTKAGVYDEDALRAQEDRT